ncbi:hypothetical protein EOD39_18908 [Acipenser ruthenus]|uniref:Uncharacterized protein n=1 Tax=Acipenser ruthenus TaxID=7906 RepID=A0A444UZI5_ACIRT|nr:hypothetical protein EOD39_18908 [Acipenser ruthenus]
MVLSRKLTVQEALDIFESEEDAQEVYLEPPDPAVQSDEDSADDEGGLVDNLSGRQLRSGAVVVLASGEHLGDEILNETQGDVPEPHLDTR